MPVNDPRRCPPHQIVKILNSFPNLGPVVTIHKLRKYRELAGFAVSSDGMTVDLLRFCAWVIARRHATKTPDTNIIVPGSFEEYQRDKADSLRKALARPSRKN